AARIIASPRRRSASARAAVVNGSVGMSAAPRVGEDEDPLDGLAGHIDHVVGGGDRREVLILVASALAALGVDERTGVLIRDDDGGTVVVVGRGQVVHVLVNVELHVSSPSWWCSR